MRLIYRIIIVSFLIILDPMMLTAHEASKHTGDANPSPAPVSLYQYLNPGEKAPDFNLINQEGKEISMEKLKGNPLIFTPVYASCPDACPLILHNREKIEKSLEDDIGKGAIFIAVTVDPEHDTPEVLKEFMTKLGVNPVNFHLLTGDPEIVNKVLADYKIRVRIDAKEGHVLGHSVIGYAIDSNGIVKKAIQFAQ